MGCRIGRVIDIYQLFFVNSTPNFRVIISKSLSEYFSSIGAMVSDSSMVSKLIPSSDLRGLAVAMAAMLPLLLYVLGARVDMLWRNWCNRLSASWTDSSRVSLVRVPGKWGRGNLQAVPELHQLAEGLRGCSLRFIQIAEEEKNSYTPLISCKRWWTCWAEHTSGLAYSRQSSFSIRRRCSALSTSYSVSLPP